MVDSGIWLFPHSAAQLYADQPPSICGFRTPLLRAAGNSKSQEGVGSPLNYQASTPLVIDSRAGTSCPSDQPQELLDDSWGRTISMSSVSAPAFSTASRSGESTVPESCSATLSVFRNKPSEQHRVLPRGPRSANGCRISAERVRRSIRRNYQCVI